jgi:hypothetical protein
MILSFKEAGLKRAGQSPTSRWGEWRRAAPVPQSGRLCPGAIAHRGVGVSMSPNRGKPWIAGSAIVWAAVLAATMTSGEPGTNVSQDSAPTGVVEASSLQGKVLCGYQGWFRCPGDKAGQGWVHWAPYPAADALPTVRQPESLCGPKNEKRAQPPKPHDTPSISNIMIIRRSSPRRSVLWLV